MAAVISPNSHQHTKGCTSATCCSPSRLWRTIQTLISSDSKEEFQKLCQDSDRGPHVLRVLLTARIANDVSLYPASHKHRVIQHDPSVRQQATLKFGKSVTDLNALQLALFCRREAMAIQLLTFLRRHAQPYELSLFVNHVWGNKNTSLHLACFLCMPRLVRLLLELGADPNVKNARNVMPANCCNKECLVILQKHSPTDKILSTSSTMQKKASSPATAAAAPTATAAPLQPALSARMNPDLNFYRPSMLLKKANEATDLLTSPPPTIVAFPTPSVLTDDYFAVTDVKKKMRLSLPAALSPVEEEEDDDEFDDEDDEDDRGSLPSMSSVDDDEDEICKPSTPDLVRSPHPSLTTLRSSYHHASPRSPTTSPTQPPPILVDRSRLKSTKTTQHRQVRFDPEVALVDACNRGDLEEVVQLTQQKKPPDINCVGIHNRSLLHLALMHGHDKVVKYLIDFGMDADHTDADGWSALHYAAVLKSWWAFEYLLMHNAKLSVLTNDGYKIQDCPETEADRRRCRCKFCTNNVGLSLKQLLAIIDRVLQRQN
ncbi:hypothetical protein DFQ28_008177 [Apophysomyces sp. BC1034]|nr:hypothetical protein DFQ30_007891 [Apophysomyces sp. BC1015]KAG0175816.1 hypothetical protein DFQ29_006981 [Apophysomyces sp. BC1021]KAG0186204.1 hypothetical protein DFQ28_008177 [Apophysomyces sp. BC1034]